MVRIASTTLICVLALSILVLVGCGSSNSSTTRTTTSAQSAAQTSAAKAAVKKAAEAVKKAEAKAPKGASPTLRQLYRQFPTPVAGPHEGTATAAIIAGERDCAGKTPLEVKERFYAVARPNLEPEQARMIARIGTFKAHASTDPSFVAGQLAADTYAATLPEAAAQAGYQGCIYALAQGLERRLAPEEK